MLHVLGEALQEAEWLVENNWHCDLGQLLRKTFYYEIMTGRRGTPIHDAIVKPFFYLHCEISCFFPALKLNRFAFLFFLNFGELKEGLSKNKNFAHIFSTNCRLTIW